MRAAILSIGDELTLGQNAETNGAWLAQQLAGLAIVPFERRVVADDRLAIAEAVRDLAAAADVLLITGGLGPTADDLTRQALGDALTPGSLLVTDDAAAAHLEARFARRGQSMPRSNLVQAQRPESMRFLPNPHGTAMGLAGRMGACAIFSMPGPPAEMRPMFRDHVLSAIRVPSLDMVIRTTAVHALGLGESAAAERLGELMDRDRHPLVGTTVSQSIVSARVRARGRADEVEEKMSSTVDEIEKRWWPYAYGRDELTLPHAVGQLLRERGATVASAESCTGGLLGAMLVSAPGASDYYQGGWITYSNGMKQSELGVPRAIIERWGAVSEQVALAMARGARERCQAMGREPDFSLAITGIAGPEGGTPAKPVGTVFIALARRGPGGDIARRFEFGPERDQVRERSAKCALQMLRFALLQVPDEMAMLWESAGPRVVVEQPG